MTAGSRDHIRIAVIATGTGKSPLSVGDTGGRDNNGTGEAVLACGRQDFLIGTVATGAGENFFTLSRTGGGHGDGSGIIMVPSGRDGLRVMVATNITSVGTDPVCSAGGFMG